MKTERELFEEWFEGEYLNCKIADIVDREYWALRIDFSWEAWQASTSRDGYKLLPVEPTEEMLEALESAHIPDYEGGMYYAEQGYKAMIGAYNADNE